MVLRLKYSRATRMWHLSSSYRVGMLCRMHSLLKKQLPPSGSRSLTLLFLRCLSETWGRSQRGVSSASRRWGSRSWSLRCQRRMLLGLGRSRAHLLFCKRSGRTAVHSSSSLLEIWVARGQRCKCRNMRTYMSVFWIKSCANACQTMILL